MSCLTVLFDSLYFDDSLEASKRNHDPFLLLRSSFKKHKYISLSLNRCVNPFDKRNLVIVNSLLLIKAAKVRV